MILDRLKELNLTDEEIKEKCAVFDEDYEEYINDIEQINKMSTYVYQNPIDKMKKIVKTTIIKNLKNNDDTYNNYQFDTKYGHKEKEKSFSKKIKEQNHSKNKYNRNSYGRNNSQARCYERT